MIKNVEVSMGSKKNSHSNLEADMSYMRFYRYAKSYV